MSKTSNRQLTFAISHIATDRLKSPVIVLFRTWNWHINTGCATNPVIVTITTEHNHVLQYEWENYNLPNCCHFRRHAEQVTQATVHERICSVEFLSHNQRRSAKGNNFQCCPSLESKNKTYEKERRTRNPGLVTADLQIHFQIVIDKILVSKDYTQVYINIHISSHLPLWRLPCKLASGW